MEKTTTQLRLEQIMNERNLKQSDILRMSEPYQKLYGIKLTKSVMSQYLSGKNFPGQNKLFILSKTLNVSPAWLMGFDVPMTEEDTEIADNAMEIADLTKKYAALPPEMQHTVKSLVDNLYNATISNQNNNL